MNRVSSERNWGTSNKGNECATRKNDFIVHGLRSHAGYTAPLYPVGPGSASDHSERQCSAYGLGYVVLVDRSDGANANGLLLHCACLYAKPSAGWGLLVGNRRRCRRTASA